MPDIKIYDYQKVHHPRIKWAVSHPMPSKKTDNLRSNAPWVNDHILCCYYDDADNLIGVRFVYRDGKYVDLIEVEDEAKES